MQPRETLFDVNMMERTGGGFQTMSVGMFAFYVAVESLDRSSLKACKVKTPWPPFPGASASPIVPLPPWINSF